MTETLFQIHQWIGYLVSIVVLVSAMMAFSRAKDSREFSKGPYVGAMILLDVQVLLGLLLYGAGGYWDADPMIAYVHPIVALAALGVGHAFVGKARKAQMVTEAHRTAGRGLMIAFVLVLVAVGIATVF